MMEACGSTEEYQLTPTREHHFRKASQKYKGELASQRAELSMSQAKGCRRKNVTWHVPGLAGGQLWFEPEISEVQGWCRKNTSFGISQVFQLSHFPVIKPQLSNF
jgi:hypothetical protein